MSGKRQAPELAREPSGAPDTRSGRVRRGAWRALVVSLAVLGIGVGMAGNASAYPGPGDDRMKTNSTAWWTYQNQDPVALENLVKEKKARITDLRVVDNSPLKLSATMVSNSGAYATGWWWYYGKTEQQVKDLLRENGARLISAYAYWGSSSLLFAVVMVPNTGANAVTWGWAYGPQAFVISKVDVKSERVTNLTAFDNNGEKGYVIIKVANTQNLEWHWLFGIDAGTLDDFQDKNDLSVIDISVNDDDTLNAVYVKSPVAGVGWAVFYETDQKLVDEALNTGFRALLLVPYVNSNGDTWWVAPLNYNF